MNNLGMLMQAYKNPQAFIQQAMNNSQMMQNPLIKNAVEMYQRGDTQGLNNMANNIAKERNIDINQLKNEIKSQIGV